MKGVNVFETQCNM